MSSSDRPAWPWVIAGAFGALILVGVFGAAFVLGRDGGNSGTLAAASVTSSPPPVAVTVTVTATPTTATPTTTTTPTASVAPAPIVTVTRTATPAAFSGDQLFSLDPDSSEFAARADSILCSGQYLPEIGRSESAAWPVLIAQRQLNAIFPSAASDPNNITVNGVFGPITERQTARFQYDSGATVTGRVGPETWQRFRDIRCNGAAVPAQRAASTYDSDAIANELCGWRDYPTVSSSQGTPEQVALLQAALAGRGYDPGPIDGAFGARTESALRTYQAKRGLTVDGLAGPQTWRSLQVSYCDIG